MKFGLGVPYLGAVPGSTLSRKWAGGKFVQITTAAGASELYRIMLYVAGLHRLLFPRPARASETVSQEQSSNTRSARRFMKATRRHVCQNVPVIVLASLVEARGARNLLDQASETTRAATDLRADSVYSLDDCATLSDRYAKTAKRRASTAISGGDNSTVLCTIEPQMCFHWLLPQIVASVTPHLAVWHSPRVNLHTRLQYRTWAPLACCILLRLQQYVTRLEELPRVPDQEIQGDMRCLVGGASIKRAASQGQRETSREAGRGHDEDIARSREITCNWGETGEPRENPPTSGVVRHDSHLTKIRSDPAGFALVGGEESYRSATAAPCVLVCLPFTLEELEETSGGRSLSNLTALIAREMLAWVMVYPFDLAFSGRGDESDEEGWVLHGDLAMKFAEGGVWWCPCDYSLVSGRVCRRSRGKGWGWKATRLIHIPAPEPRSMLVQIWVRKRDCVEQVGWWVRALGRYEGRCWHVREGTSRPHRELMRGATSTPPNYVRELASSAPLASHQGGPGSSPDGVAPVVPDDAAFRRVFTVISRSPHPTLHSGASLYSPRFTIIGSEDLDVKSHPNIFTHSLAHSELCRKGKRQLVYPSNSKLPKTLVWSLPSAIRVVRVDASSSPVCAVIKVADRQTVFGVGRDGHRISTGARLYEQGDVACPGVLGDDAQAVVSADRLPTSRFTKELFSRKIIGHQVSHCTALDEALSASKQTPPGGPSAPDITAGNTANKVFVFETLLQQHVQRWGRAVRRHASSLQPTASWTSGQPDWRAVRPVKLATAEGKFCSSKSQRISFYKAYLHEPVYQPLCKPTWNIAMKGAVLAGITAAMADIA
ncbi:hypothetical protein PR048_029084 [Dryococelus australis]|uniref:Uncharacterized protein n=1 Tax=Dryococelus australis TaxID=614101 RepID=A0ABQ9GF56_9NEOP|nr:hypothetical protein PR048_029084 [Dryococelus australis]